MNYASGETCTFHPNIPADASCSKCGRPFCKACLTLIIPSAARSERGISIHVGNLGGLVCLECKMKGEAKGALFLALMGFIWIFMELAFLASVPSWGRGFFLTPMTIISLMALGFIAVGVVRYLSSQEKLRRFQASLPLKATFPSRLELGVAKCPNCGGTLRKIPQKIGDIVLCDYCGTPIVAEAKRLEANDQVTSVKG